MNRHLRPPSRRGFSLLEVLLGLGILSLITLGVGASMSHLFQQQQNIMSGDTGDNFSAAFFQHLLVSQNCNATVANRPAPTGTTETDLDVSTFSGVKPGASPGIRAGTEVDRSLFVNRVFMRQKQGVSPETVQFGSNQHRRYILQVVLRLERRIPNEPSRPLPDRVLEIPVLSQAGNPAILQYCQMEANTQDVCESMGGMIVDGKCKLGSQCTVNGTFIRTTCNDPNAPCEPEYTGDDRDNRVTGGASCPAGSCAIQSGSFTIERSIKTGKKSSKLIKVTENFYLCMQCDGMSCGGSSGGGSKK